MLTASPDFILYAQHGWADGDQAIAELAYALATPNTRVIAPDLGYIKTWLRIEPLIEAVETIVRATIAQYPDTPMRIIGHSMGGLIWLEVLNRHPEWWPQVEALILVASPVGGADLGRLIDPLGLGLGIARDLGKNRRVIAEKIAAVIPTLSIAGDKDGGSDGTITVQSSRFNNARFVCLPGLAHSAMKNHAATAMTIREFWEQLSQHESPVASYGLVAELVQHLQAVPGMTDAHYRDFARSDMYLTFKDGTTLRYWKNPLGVAHVFVGDSTQQCCYGGFVGWVHNKGLEDTLARLKQQYYHLCC